MPQDDDLKRDPFGGKRGRRPFFRLVADVYDFVTLPAAVYFILRSARIHSDYRLSRFARLRLGWRMYWNARKVFTGTSWRAHLAMAQKILSIPRETPGVVVECGCFRGGATANLSLICQIAGRELIVYDSFKGLPPPSEGDAFANPFIEGFLTASVEQVRDHVSRNGHVDCCTFVEGFFEDTLPDHSKPIALMFLDVDLAASLHDCILNLWRHLDKEGYVFIDEYLLTDYCALFYSEKYWKKYFNTTPPGLIGAGSGAPLGAYYLGPFTGLGATDMPRSIAYTRKDLSGLWSYYPDEIERKKTLAAQS